MAVLAIIFIVGVGFAAMIAYSKNLKKIEMTLGWLAEKLGGGCDLEKLIAWGEIGGAEVCFRLTTRGSGKNTSYWTEIDAEVPKRYPLRLFVRKHGWLDQGKIDRGDMVDVLVGDPAFDKRFLVEAAPSEVARILLDPRERSYLMALSEKLHFDIDTHRSSESPFLRLSVRQWVDDVHDAMRAIEAMAAIVGRVRAAYAAVDQAAQARDSGSPYRPVLDDTDAQAAAHARLEEVARVDKLRTARVAREQAFVLAVVLIFVLVAIFVVAGGA